MKKLLRAHAAETPYGFALLLALGCLLWGIADKIHAAVTSQSGVSLNVTDGVVSYSPSFSFSTTAAGAALVGQPQVITTNWTLVNLGLAASADLMLLKNNDTTNYVQLATTGTNVFSKLLPGRFAFVPVDPGATIYVRGTNVLWSTNVSINISVFVVNP